MKEHAYLNYYTEVHKVICLLLKGTAPEKIPALSVLLMTEVDHAISTIQEPAASLLEVVAPFSTNSDIAPMFAKSIYLDDFAATLERN